MINLLKKHWFVIVLLLVAFFLRFYKLSDLYFFNIDEDWSNFIIRKITVLHKPVLIGWDIPGGFYVPPVMYYFGAFLMFIFKNNPLGFAVNASLVSVLAVLLIYFVGEKIFQSKKIAVFASIIYCFSYFVNIYNRLTVNLYLVPVLSLLTYFSLYQIIKKNKQRWFYPLAVILIFSTQEGATVSLIVLAIVSLVLFKPKLKLRNIVLPLLIFFASFASLLLFDFRHDFQIIKKYLSITENITSSKHHDVQIVPSFRVLFNTFGRFIIPTGPNDLNIQILPCTKYLNIISQATPKIFPLLGLVLIGLFLVLSKSKKKSSFGRKIIIIHLLITMLGLVMYSFLGIDRIHEWFFVMFTPAFSFIISYLLSFIDEAGLGKITVFIILSFVLINNFRYFVTGTAAVGFKDKLAAVIYTKKVLNEQSFEFEVLGNGCNKYGYRYLFTYINFEPVKSYIDYQFAGWLYPETYIRSINYKVVFVPLIDIETEQMKEEYDKYKNKAVNTQKIDNLEVLIIKSSEQF